MRSCLLDRIDREHYRCTVCGRLLTNRDLSQKGLPKCEGRGCRS